VTTVKRALACGDYGVTVDGRLVAVVERRSLADLVSSLINGKLRYASATSRRCRERPSPLRTRCGPRLQPGRCRLQVNGRRSPMAGKFDLYKDASDKYRWRLKDSNGEVIASGEAYESKSAAKDGIASVRLNAADAEVVEVERSSRSISRWSRCCSQPEPAWPG
jgi:uncharacterized protein YegP (UPF0339 family)